MNNKIMFAVLVASGFHVFLDAMDKRDLNWLLSAFDTPKIEPMWRSEGRDMQRKLYVPESWDVYAGNGSGVQKRVEDFPSKTSIEREIEQFKAASVEEGVKHRQLCGVCTRSKYCYKERERRLLLTLQKSHVILNAGDLFSDQEKLNTLSPDTLFPQRKAIIKKMISEGHHPDSIVYQVDNKAPLKEVLHFKDKEFFNFLLEHDATLKIDRDGFMTEPDYDRYQAVLQNLIQQQSAQKEKNINIVNGIELDLDDID